MIRKPNSMRHLDDAIRWANALVLQIDGKR